MTHATLFVPVRWATLYQLDNPDFLSSVSAFVRSDRVRQFPGLRVKYTRGADPVIKLLNDNREVVETLGIDKWNTDSVEEFFREHLSN